MLPEPLSLWLRGRFRSCGRYRDLFDLLGGSWNGSWYDSRGTIRRGAMASALSAAF